MNKTNIQYLDYTWNPIAMRCDRVSPGCDNCWHLGMANRMKANPVLNKTRREAYDGKDPVLNLTELLKPKRLRIPSKIGVQFMGDLFHPNISNGFIEHVFSIISSCGYYDEIQHTFFILTKRPTRMMNFIKEYMKEGVGDYFDHLWVGVSVENQETADKRIPLLLQCPVKNRWISVEPLLGPVQLEHNLMKFACDTRDLKTNLVIPKQTSVDWVVCGAETGPKKRAMHWEWAISLANQCKSAGVPFFFKEPWETAPDACRRRELPEMDRVD